MDESVLEVPLFAKLYLKNHRAHLDMVLQTLNRLPKRSLRDQSPFPVIWIDDRHFRLMKTLNDDKVG